MGLKSFSSNATRRAVSWGGNYVFPGGRVNREDSSLETCALARGVTPEQACQMFGEALTPEESIAHWIAAIRELFEEAGILLACDEKDHLFRPKTPEDRVTLENYRRSLQKGDLTIGQIAKKMRLCFALDRLTYFAHWITPEARTLRFDTRFFLAVYPEGQETSFDQKETVAEVWITPKQGLEENLRGGRIVLSPPTLLVLEELAQYGNMEEVFDSLKKREIKPILPILKNLEGEFLIFPWDPEYEVFKRGDLSSTVHHGRLSKPGETTTRLIYQEGIWYPYCRPS